MDLISTSWSCQRCGGAFISTPPEYGLCDQCLRDLHTLAQAAQPPSLPCPQCGGPVCPDCGDPMTLLIPVPMPQPPVPAAYQHHGEVNDDGS
jgi:predicted amidophosphoribosyltransferase